MKPVNAAKFSVSIPAELARFLDIHRQTHNLSRSDVFARAVRKLRDAELAEAYQAHAEAWAHDSDRGFWDRAAVDDGLDATD